MNPPDLANPWWTVLGWALVLWVAATIVWLREDPSRHVRLRRSLARIGRLARRVRRAARDRRGLRHVPLEASSSTGAGPHAGGRRHAASVRAEQEHDDARGVRPLPRLDLTDDELTALARHLADHGRGVLTIDRDAYLSALVKLDRAALDAVHAERVARRG